MRTKRLAAVAVTVALLGVVGGSASAETSGPVGRYSTVDAYAATGVDERYLATMRLLVPGSAFENSTGADLIGFGKNFCANGADSSALAMTDDVRDMFGISPGELRAILRVMAGNYCPDLLAGV